MSKRRHWIKEAARRFFSSRLRDHEIRTGLLNGAKIHTSWHDYPGAILGTTERALLRWFTANVCAGETWLDVGAHYGYTAVALSRLVGESGRVFAFEPVVSTAGCLSRTRDLNGLDQLTVVPLALGEAPHLQKLRVPATRGMADYTLAGPSPAETIYATSLDALWPSLSGEDPVIDGIKIDVQGLELQVLLGMRQLLKLWAPRLVVELHRGVERTHVLELLKSVGYSPNFEPISGQRASGRLEDDVSYAFHPEVTVCA